HAAVERGRERARDARLDALGRDALERAVDAEQQAERRAVTVCEAGCAVAGEHGVQLGAETGGESRSLPLRRSVRCQPERLRPGRGGERVGVVAAVVRYL